MNTTQTGYYVDQTLVPLLNTYVYFQFNFAAQVIVIVNDETSGTNLIDFSYDGTTKHGEVKPTERLTLDFVDCAGLWLKYESGAPDYRVMARPE